MPREFRLLISRMISFVVFGILLSAAGAKGQTITAELSSRLATPQGDSAGCLTASANSDGAPATIQACDTSNGQQLLIHSGVNPSSGPITAFRSKCLDVTSGVNANGVKLQFWTCGQGNPNQQFTILNSGVIQWTGTNKCVDVTNGNTTAGNQLQIWECAANNANQEWIPAVGLGNTLSAANLVGGPNDENLPEFCIAAESSANGSPIVLVACADIQSFFASGSVTLTIPTFPSSGPIKMYGDTKCIDVPNGNSTNGNKLQIWDCADGNTNQMFVVPKLGTVGAVTWFGTNKCLDLTNGNDAPGTPIQIWDCGGIANFNQDWQTIQPSG